MIFNLVRAELIRLVTRRFTLVMVVVLAATFGVTLATVAGTTHRPSELEVTRAEQQATSERANVRLLHDQCVLAQRPDAPPERRLAYRGVQCDTDYDASSIGPEDFFSGVFSYAGSMRSLVLFLSAFLALFGFLVGASFVGAEMTSGGMTNLLLWRPRRLQVLGTKLGVLLAGVAGLAVVATLAYLGTFWAVAEVAGHPGQQTGAFWGGLALVCLRGIALALVAAAAAFAAATAGRHTSTAVGLLAGYAVVWEIGARIIMEVVDTDHVGRWMLSSYLGAWMNGRISVGDETGPYEVRWWHAGLLFAVLLAVVVGGSFRYFRRRDLA